MATNKNFNKDATKKATKPLKRASQRSKFPQTGLHPFKRSKEIRKFYAWRRETPQYKKMQALLSENSRAYLRNKIAGPLNKDFYSAAEGVYTSYWLGKFIALWTKKGLRKTASLHTYKALSLLKYTARLNPLLMLLEILDKSKPTFRLRNYIVRRVIVKEYPVVALRSRLLMTSLHWLHAELSSSRQQIGSSLAESIALRLLAIKNNPRKNALSKKRTEYTKKTIMAQFNIRYNWK